MPRHKTTPAPGLMERMLGEASWLLSHAQALADYGRPEEATVELARAAVCAEQVACLLEADGQEREAAIHRVSAAGCFQKLGQYPRAVTLLRAALSAPLPAAYRQRVEEQLARCLVQARQAMRKQSPRRPRTPAAP